MRYSGSLYLRARFFSIDGRESCEVKYFATLSSTFIHLFLKFHCADFLISDFRVIPVIPCNYFEESGAYLLMIWYCG